MLEGVICRQRFSSQKNTCSANDHVLFRDRDAIYRYYIMKLLKQVAMRIWIFREQENVINVEHHQENILLVFMSLNPLPISFSITKPLYAFPSGQYLKFLKLVHPIDVWMSFLQSQQDIYIFITFKRTLDYMYSINSDQPPDRSNIVHTAHVTIWEW